MKGAAPSRRARPAVGPGALLVVALLALALPAAPVRGAAEAAAIPSPAERARLEAGETVVRVAPAAGAEAGATDVATGGAGGVASGWAWRILDAPAERLLRAVADWPHYAEFFPFVAESGLEPGAAVPGAAAAGPDRPVRFRQRIDLPFPFADRSFAADAVVRVAGTGAAASWTVAWSLVPGSGDVAENRGAWTLREVAPGRTLVELRLRSDTGVPAALQRRALADALPWALDGLRQQVMRCRYDVPIHPTCGEAPPGPLPVVATVPEGAP